MTDELTAVDTPTSSAGDRLGSWLCDDQAGSAACMAGILPPRELLAGEEVTPALVS